MIRPGPEKHGVWPNLSLDNALLILDVDAGIKRIHTMACPPNAARLHTGTPCERTGVCGNCHEDGCMCCNIVVTRHNRHTGRIKVILIAEDLGY